MTESGPRRSWRCSPQAMTRLLGDLDREGVVVEGGPVEGRVTASTPVGDIEGRYLYDGQTLTVTVTRRPVLVPIGMIWDRLDRACGEPVAEA